MIQSTYPPYFRCMTGKIMPSKTDKQLAQERLQRALHQLQLAIQTRELSYGAAPLVLASEHLLKEAIRIQTDG